MAKVSSSIGLYVLCGCLLLLLLVCYCKTEGFDSSTSKTSAVPDLCGSYGYKFTDGHMAILKQLNKDKDLKPLEGILAFNLMAGSIRQYTPADCTSLGGTIIQLPQGPGTSLCALLTDPSKKDANGAPLLAGNVTTDFNNVCKDLNAKATSPPSECNVNKSVVGKLNKKFTFTFNKNQYIVPDNTYRFYTEAECDSLQNGQFVGLDSLKGAIESDDFLKNQGENIGFCVGQGKDGAPTIFYSLACAAEQSYMAAVGSFF